MDYEADLPGCRGLLQLHYRVCDVLPGLEEFYTLLVALTGKNKDALKKAKMQNAAGKQVTYTISRAGAERRIAATLAEVPAEVLAQWEKEYDRAVAVAQTDN